MNRRGFDLDIGAAWLSKNPLTQANLESEAKHWEALGIPFRVNEVQLSDLPRQARVTKL